MIVQRAASDRIEGSVEIQRISLSWFGPQRVRGVRLLDETGADAVFWNRLYEPAARERDRALAAALKERGIRIGHSNAALLWQPGSICTKSGDPYRVFTPFWKACRKAEAPGAPRPAPDELSSPERWPESLSVEDLERPIGKDSIEVRRNMLGANSVIDAGALPTDCLYGVQSAFKGRFGGQQTIVMAEQLRTYGVDHIHQSSLGAPVAVERRAVLRMMFEKTAH